MPGALNQGSHPKKFVTFPMSVDHVMKLLDHAAMLNSKHPLTCE